MRPLSFPSFELTHTASPCPCMAQIRLRGLSILFFCVCSVRQSVSAHLIVVELLISCPARVATEQHLCVELDHGSNPSPLQITYTFVGLQSCNGYILSVSTCICLSGSWCLRSSILEEAQPWCSLCKRCSLPPPTARTQWLGYLPVILVRLATLILV